MKSFYFNYWFKSGLIIAFLSIFPVTNGATPTIYTRVEPSLVKICEKATFTCETDLTANVKIWWTLNGNKFNRFSNTTSTPKKTISTLQLTCAKLKHTGTYTCNVQSITGNWSTNKSTFDQIYSKRIRLQVWVPLRIFSTRFVKGEIGKSVTLSCKVVGFPVPRMIEWLKFGLWNKANYKTSQQVVDDTSLNSTLEIHNLTKSDVTRYTCRATTNVDYITTDVTIYNKGLKAPNIRSIEIIDPSNVKLNWNSPSSDEGVSINLHRISIKWRRSISTSGTSDGSTESTVISISSDETKELHTFHSCFIKYMVEGFYYTVMIAACNDYVGCSDWSAEETFFFSGYSSPPQGVKSTCHQDNTKLESYIDIAWSKPANPKAEIKYYRVKLMGSASYVNSIGTRIYEKYVSREFESYTTNITIQAMQNTNYTAQVCAKTIVGFGNFSKVTADTFCSTPPSAPKEMPHFELTKLEPTDDCRQFKLHLKGINQRYGPIECYNIILYKMNHRNESIPQPHQIILSNYTRVHEENFYGAYIAESIKSEEFQKEIILGNNNQSRCEILPDKNAVSDGELSPGTFYSGFVVVTVIGEDNVILRSWSNLFSPLKTGSVPKNQQNSFTAMVIGIVVGLIIVETICVIFITIRRYKWQPRLNEIFCCVCSRPQQSNKSLPPIPEEVNLRQRPADIILSTCQYEAVSRDFEDVRASTSHDDKIEIEFPYKSN